MERTGLGRGISSIWISVLVLIAVATALPLQHGKNRTGFAEITEVRSFLSGEWNTTCFSEAPLPDSAADYLGCVSASDLNAISVSADVVSLVSSDDNPKSATQIIENIMTPLQEIVDTIISASGKVPGYDDNLCFGNWVAEDLDFDGCDDMPLNSDSEYTILAMSMEMPMSGICADEGTAAFCIAVSLCPDTYLPTLAVNVAATTLSCIAEKVAAFDMGISSIATKAAEFAVDSIGFGLSLSQQFETDLYIYTALDDWDNKLITYTLAGMYYDQIIIEITPSEWFGDSLPDIISFGGRAIRTMGISGLDSDSINDIFSGYSASYDDSGELTNDIADSFLTFAEEVSIQFGISIDLTMSFAFSELENGLGAILPDTDTMELAQADAFLQTASTTQTVDDTDLTIRPGLYAFTGLGALSSVISGLVEWFLSFLQSIINLGGDWLPFDLEDVDFVSKILDAMDTSSGDEFGFGFAVTDEAVGLYLNLPLIFADLGYFRAECKFTWDDASLDCSVDTSLNTNFFKAIAEVTKEGILWLARETDEAFEELGNIIAAGLEDATDAAGAWVEENVEKTVSLIKSGAIELEDDIKEELENWAKWGETVFGDIVDDLSEFTTEAVQEVSAWGTQAIADAESDLKEAEETLDDVVDELSTAFGCGSDSILSSLTGCDDDCCDGLDSAISWLDEASGDVTKAFEDAWDDVTDFAEDVGDFLYSERTSRSYTSFDPAEYDSTYGCEIKQIYLTKTTVVMGITLYSKTEYGGTTLDSDCLKSRIDQSKDLGHYYDIVQAKKTRLANTQSENGDAVFGSTVSASDLISAGFTCDKPEIDRSSASDGKVPVSITCYSAAISKEGALNDSTVNATLNESIDLSEMGASAAADIAALQKAVAQALTAKITEGFTSPHSTCVPTAAPAADGTDNNCDGSIDNQNCDYDDFNDYLSERDCACNAPELSAVDDVKLLCSADRSPTALGYPEVSTDEDNGCTSGTFFGITTELVDDSDPVENCGAATYLRTFNYYDSRFQKSNVVTQTITTTQAMPVLNETLVEPLVYMACELAVGDNGQNAPEETVPFNLGSSNCTTDITKGYHDGDIDYVGCPSNPAVDGESYKGWNVDREWFVEDKCGNGDFYTQRIVRTDDTSPDFESVPVMRVQSCRADFDAANSGYPVAEDNCDSSDVINPDWTAAEGSRGGRITYADSGDSVSGCAIDMTRTFTAKDRVCNSATAAQRIQAFEFDFVQTESDTPYDSSSLLPTFSINLDDELRPAVFANDQLVFVAGDLETEAVETCNVGPQLIQYLDTTADDGLGAWADMPKSAGLFAPSCIKFDNKDSTLSLNLGHNNDDAVTYLTQLLEDASDDEGRVIMKFQVDCKLVSTKKKVSGFAVAYIHK